MFKSSRISQGGSHKTSVNEVRISGNRNFAGFSEEKVTQEWITSSDVTKQTGRIPRGIMFLIDDSYELMTSRLELFTEKIAPPAITPRLSRSRLLRTLAHSMESGTSTIISGRA